MNTALNEQTIGLIKRSASEMIQQAFSTDAVQIILYGSCARGDFSADSDVDIAVLTHTGREAMDRYTKPLAEIATQLALQYFQVVNIICIPYEEYLEKKNWYSYYQNIETEGEVLYGTGIQR